GPGPLPVADAARGRREGDRRRRTRARGPPRRDRSRCAHAALTRVRSCDRGHATRRRVDRHATLDRYNSSVEHAFESTSVEAMRARIAALEAALESERARSKEREGERDRALAAYRALLAELEVLRRKIFAAKAERIDTAQLELEFADRLAALGEFEKQLEVSEPESTKGTPRKSKPKPKGRRKLADSDLPVERIEIDDPVMEALVAEGRAERIGFEESSRV